MKHLLFCSSSCLLRMLRFVFDCNFSSVAIRNNNITSNEKTSWIVRSSLVRIIVTISAAVVMSAHADDFLSGAFPVPELRLARTLPAPNEIGPFRMYQSGTSRLTWSPDGKRLAAYIKYGLGIMIWSADGQYQSQLPRHNHFGLDAYLLGFVSGSHEIITSPAASSDNSDDEDKIEGMAFSVMDATSGKIVHQVAGPNLGKTFRENIAQHQAISPDQQLVAVVYHPYAGPRVGVYSTRDWQQIAEIVIGDVQGPRALGLGLQALSFSPDGKKLAVALGRSNRVNIYQVGSWQLLRSIEPFPETPPPMHILSLSGIAFSPDGSMIAVGSFSGGTHWKTPDGQLSLKGIGKQVEEFPPDPLRVFRTDDGSLVATAAGFPGGFAGENKFAWTPDGRFVAFLDAERQLQFWNPTRPGPPTLVLKLEHSTGWLAFSPDGTQLAINFADGVKVFDVVNQNPKQ